MRYYTAIVHKDEESAYGLTFPDLPGAFAAADDWDGIPAAATEALDLWFDDQADMAPAPLDTIRNRPDVAAALADGAVLIPVPYIPADTTTERVNITMERGLLRAIDRIAKDRGMTRSSFLASAARREIVGAQSGWTATSWKHPFPSSDFQEDRGSGGPFQTHPPTARAAVRAADCSIAIPSHRHGV